MFASYGKGCISCYRVCGITYIWGFYIRVQGGYIVHTHTHTHTHICPSILHSPHLPPSLPPPEQVRSSGSCVLIHCMAGISRSVTLVIAYLMQYYGLPMQQAYQFVKDKRSAISPNLNFMGQLLEFDRTIKEHKLTQFLDISAYRPTAEQEKLLENMRAKSSESSSM